MLKNLSTRDLIPGYGIAYCRSKKMITQADRTKTDTLPCTQCGIIIRHIKDAYFADYNTLLKLSGYDAEKVILRDHIMCIFCARDYHKDTHKPYFDGSSTLEKAKLEKERQIRTRQAEDEQYGFVERSSPERHPSSRHASSRHGQEIRGRVLHRGKYY